MAASLWFGSGVCYRRWIGSGGKTVWDGFERLFVSACLCDERPEALEDGVQELECIWKYMRMPSIDRRRITGAQQESWTGSKRIDLWMVRESHCLFTFGGHDADNTGSLLQSIDLAWTAARCSLKTVDRVYGKQSRWFRCGSIQLTRYDQRVRGSDFQRIGCAGWNNGHGCTGAGWALGSQWGWTPLYLPFALWGAIPDNIVFQAKPPIQYRWCDFQLRPDAQSRQSVASSAVRRRISACAGDAASAAD